MVLAHWRVSAREDVSARSRAAWLTSICVAASNSPVSTVLSGDRASLEGFLARMEGVGFRRLGVEVAFHSPQMDDLQSELAESLSALVPRSGTVPMISTVTASVLEGREFGGNYWAENLRKPVQFAGMAGDAEWWVGQTVVETDQKPGPVFAVVDVAQVQRAVRHPARRPSDGKQGAVRVAPLFALGLGAAADFGAAVHRMLAEVEWIDSQELIQLEMKWRAAKNVPESALGLALAGLRAVEMASVWARPAGGSLTEVWRERAFEVVLDGVWFTGVFDRVIIERDHEGRIVSAWVIDFKTDHVGEGSTDARIAEKHGAQINLYRRAAGILTGLSLSKVRCSVALLAGPRLVDVSLLV